MIVQKIPIAPRATLFTIPAATLPVKYDPNMTGPMRRQAYSTTLPISSPSLAQASRLQ